MMAMLARSRGALSGWHQRRLAQGIETLLDQPGPPDTGPAEADFARLQAEQPPRPEYGYDRVSLANRAAARMAAILQHIPRTDVRLSTLDVATGDGMIGALFAATGCDAAICDMVDWRAEAARSLPFEMADCCQSLPYADGRFDIVSSFNSFEHMPDPAAAFAEIVRVTKPGGLIYLDFGPLYASAWGLHAYRSVRMPYPQFLFSNAFLTDRLRETGIDDLGKAREELQYVNGWKVDQYDTVWAHPQVEAVELHVTSGCGELDIIRRYPESFRGRGLRFSDVSQDHIRAVFRKRV